MRRTWRALEVDQRQVSVSDEWVAASTVTSVRRSSLLPKTGRADHSPCGPIAFGGSSGQPRPAGPRVDADRDAQPVAGCLRCQ